MMPLCLAACLTLGADPAVPAEGYYIPRECVPRTAPRWVPKGVVEEMSEKASRLAIPGRVPPGGPSFLYQPAFAEDELIRLPAREYIPQPGDIMMAADTSTFWLLMHNLAGTSDPTHSGVVFALPDGRTAILEGGPHDTVLCRVLETIPHLASYEAEGRVWIRRRKCPLTPMQSALLTEFCLAANCRDFSLKKLAIQLTPFRTRGPIKTRFVGKPRGLANEGYFCSELVIEALVYAGLMDCRTARPSATYPRDIFFGKSKNPYLNRHIKALNCGWEAPARWTGCPVSPVDIP